MRKGFLGKIIAPLLSPKNRVTTLSLLIICAMYGIVVFYNKAQTSSERMLQKLEKTTVTASEVLGEGQPQIGGQFRLKKANADGKMSIFTEENLKGKMSLLFFGYTSCPDICPTELSKITLVQDQLSPEQKQKLQVIFVSVDPQRDTPENLYHYITSFDENFIALTGTPEQIKNAADKYLVYYVVYPPEKADEPFTYNVDHSGYMYLMDKEGHYIKHFSTHTTPEEMLSTLKEVLK